MTTSLVTIAEPRYDFSVGDEIVIAWEEDGNFRRDTFVIEAVNDDGLCYDYKVANSSRTYVLVEGYVIYFLVDTSRFEERFDADSPCHLVVGAAPSGAGLAWEIVLTLIQLQFDPTEAIDFMISEYTDIDLQQYSKVRDVPQSELEDHARNIANELPLYRQERFVLSRENDGLYFTNHMR